MFGMVTGTYGLGQIPSMTHPSKTVDEPVERHRRRSSQASCSASSARLGSCRNAQGIYRAGRRRLPATNPITLRQRRACGVKHPGSFPKILPNRARAPTALVGCRWCERRSANFWKPSCEHSSCRMRRAPTRAISRDGSSCGRHRRTQSRPSCTACSRGYMPPGRSTVARHQSGRFGSVGCWRYRAIPEQSPSTSANRPQPRYPRYMSLGRKTRWSPRLSSTSRHATTTPGRSHLLVSKCIQQVWVSTGGLIYRWNPGPLSRKHDRIWRSLRQTCSNFI